MNADLALVLALLTIAIVMFAIGRPRMDAVALLMLTVLPFTGVLSMNEALAGFADANVVLIATLFVIGEGLVRTGVAQGLGNLLMAKAGKSESRLVVLLMLFVGGLGAVMSSTGVVAIFVPIVVRIAQVTGASPSGLMMPLSVAALSSGMLTLVATAPNLVVSGALERHGASPFSFFAFTPIGLVVLLLSIAYMLVARRWLIAKPVIGLPPLSRPSQAAWIERYGLINRTARLGVGEESPLAGRTLAELNLRGADGVNLLAIERPRRQGLEILEPSGKVRVFPGDVLLVDLIDPDGDVDAVAQRFALQALPRPEGFFSDRSQDLGMAEVLVGPDSALVGRSVREARFRTRFRLTVLGIRHGSDPMPPGYLEEPLRVGDTLLVGGRWKQIDALRHQDADLVVLDLPAERDDVLAAPGKGSLALAVLALVVGLMVTGVVPNVQAGLIGVLLLGALGCVDFKSAYDSIHWKSLVLIAGMMPFSIALERTGGVDLAAAALAEMARTTGPYGLLAALFAVTALIGMFVSNTATAVLMAPVAIGVADELGASPYPFAMIVAVAASAAFMTPVSSPVNTLVVGPGNYTLGDFVRIGVPLTIIVLIVSVLLIPWLFPL
jgi:di/tricarboxylate transporter